LEKIYPTTGEEILEYGIEQGNNKHRHKIVFARSSQWASDSKRKDIVEDKYHQLSFPQVTK